jgi:formylglycine-generating enzyme required for sulfatase activity
VLRGGSWYGNQEYARAGYRNLNHPVGRHGYIGFRVVVSSPMKKR